MEKIRWYKDVLKAVSNEKEGVWIKDNIAYKCSNCHTHWDYIFNYCPYCGAKMIRSNT